MAQNSNGTPHNSAYYNVSLIKWRQRQLGLLTADIVRLLDIAERTIYMVLQGRAKYQSVAQVVRLLELDWALVHDLSLPESHYHLAVRNGINQGVHPIAPIEEASNSRQAANG